MAGGTSAFTMAQSSKDNRNILSKRSRMADNPYNSKVARVTLNEPKMYDEMITERFERKKAHEFSRKAVLFIFGILVVLSISLFFI
ncbi:hypothetical protein [Cecembia lonarensis]|uniref:Uncharacterized protein n=1 Tax=Cecembia lonarensis (strain CCUG 58316 / KCTC 22772 / LW9) TaxID=1225176 RepID=K1LEB4_CECL9|nr:hypothetical protein [Cecembia lonarensis]EKB48688.1 hypothetical protein B879_02715 [Cecembia lonarensis LW9]